MVWATEETRDVSDLTIADMINTRARVRLLDRYSCNARSINKVFHKIDREAVSSVFILISDRPVSIGSRPTYAWHR